jgi:hypothetical protein
MNIDQGTTVRWYSRSGGWRYGVFVRVIHSRRGSTGIKRPPRALVRRGGDYFPVKEIEVPLADLKVYG